MFMFESVWKGFWSYSGIYFILFLKCTGSFNLAYVLHESSLGGKRGRSTDFNGL